MGDLGDIDIEMIFLQLLQNIPDAAAHNSRNISGIGLSFDNNVGLKVLDKDSFLLAIFRPHPSALTFPSI